MIIYVDIDGTICKEVKKADGSKDYPNHKPIPDRIEYLNSLYNEGHEIHYWTARGAKSGLDWTELTHKQIKEWGCKFNSITVGQKPHFDVYICDKSFNADAWFTHQKIHKEI